MAKPVITLRSVKGQALTYDELDDNFANLRDATLTVTDGVNSTQIDLNGSIEFAAGANIAITENNGVITIDSSGSSADLTSDTLTVGATAPTSRTELTVQTVGSVTRSTSQFAVGTSSANFPSNSNNYIIVGDEQPELEITGDFTLEWWSRLVDTSGGAGRLFYNWIEGLYGFSTGHFSIRYNSTSSIAVSLFGVSDLVASTVRYSWEHFALVRSGNTVTLYVNGVSQGTRTWTDTLCAGSNKRITIGALNSVINTYDNLNGQIDEVRLSDTARYTENFTPTTTQFVNDANTRALLHFESTPFSDDNITPILDTVTIKTNDSAKGLALTNGDLSGKFFIEDTGDIEIAFKNSIRIYDIDTGSAAPILGPGSGNSVVLRSNDGALSADSFIRLEVTSNLNDPGVKLQSNGLTSFEVGTYDSTILARPYQFLGGASQVVDFSLGGLRLRSITTTDRNSIPTSMQTGTIVFNSDTNTFQGYNGSAWVDLG